MSNNEDMENEVERLRKVIDSLDHDSLQALKYFIQNKSVGELLAVRELRGLYRIRDPLRTLRDLIELGLLERGIGCYNIRAEVIKALKRHQEGR